MEVTEKEQELSLEKLPYKIGDLSPVLSKDNVDYHYNVLSKGYVDRYNAGCLLYTSPSPRDLSTSRMPSSA